MSTEYEKNVLEEALKSSKTQESEITAAAPKSNFKKQQYQGAGVWVYGVLEMKKNASKSRK